VGGSACSATRSAPAARGLPAKRAGRPEGGWATTTTCCAGTTILVVRGAVDAGAAAELASRRDLLAARVAAGAARGTPTRPRRSPPRRRPAPAGGRAVHHADPRRRHFPGQRGTRLTARFSGPLVDMYADVSERLRPAYSAFVAAADVSVVSLSPELFLRRRGRTVTTSPIKGTRPRTGVDDDHEAEALRKSTKDAAENIMIVDLMRNDLARICTAGSCARPACSPSSLIPASGTLCPQWFGELPAGATDADLLRACFSTRLGDRRAQGAGDAGHRRVRIRQRDAFTGAIGFSSRCGARKFNVTIRTFEIERRHRSTGGRGGITVRLNAHRGNGGSAGAKGRGRP